MTVFEGSSTPASSGSQSGSGLSGFSSFDVATAAQLNALTAGDKVTIVIKATVQVRQQ